MSTLTLLGKKRFNLGSQEDKRDALEIFQSHHRAKRKHKQEECSSFFYYRNVARWSQRQDRVNKDFFNQFKRKNKPLSITSLKRLDGSYTSDESEMRNIVSDYYQQLLSAESFSEDALYKRQVVLATIQQKVTDVMASHLLQRFTPQEVLSATKSLGKDVCPGKDGIGVGFYLHY